MAKYIKTEQGYIDASILAPASFKPAGKSYLTFSSPKSFTLSLDAKTKRWNGTLEYFSADKTWTVWDGTTTLSSVDNDGEYVMYLRGIGNTVITIPTDNRNWIFAGSDIKCIGNIESLLDYALVASGVHPTMGINCYASMFQGCKSLTQAPELPARKLSKNCYYGMFKGCTSLTQAPALPATTLAEDCYEDMFNGCTSLTQAPALPATTLANYCYCSMFSGCTSLTQAPVLPTTTLAIGCYHSMFFGCISLTQSPALPATTLANNCYERMFRGCTSLAQAPALPATTLADYCYCGMFESCTALKLSSTKTREYTQEYRIPSSGTGTTASNALAHMFANTGGTFTGTPTINTTYYLSSNNMIVRDTEVATLNGYVGSMIDVASIQSDWNQNDSTAPDYVKNRPFYTNDSVEILMEETTVEFTRNGTIYTSTDSYYPLLVAGRTYQVAWDGTTYECTCAEFEGEAVLGNLSIQSIGEDTGEPFFYGFATFYTRDNSASHTISISRMTKEIIKIDEKYIPELQYMDKVNPTGTGAFSLNRKFNTTVGNYSFAEGYDTTASGWGSHAEGESTTASGEKSHAEGYCTKASSVNQHVEGKYNIEDFSGTYVHIVGNGTADDARSNAHTLDWSGNAWFAGTIEGKAIILPSSTEGSTKKFKITVDDSGAISATEIT